MSVLLVAEHDNSNLKEAAKKLYKTLRIIKKKKSARNTGIRKSYRGRISDARGE